MSEDLVQELATDPPGPARATPHSIPELLDTTARAWPDGVALLAPGRRPLRFAELHAQVEATAAELEALEIGVRDRIAVVLPNGPELATAFLALAAGAACAPLNPGYTASELEFYLSDLGAKALVVPAGAPTPARAVAEAQGIRVLELAADPDGPSGRFSLGTRPGEAGARRRGGGSDVALVLHTSGTTSRPKIVPLTQANLCASAENIARALVLTPEDRCLNVMPLFHIHGLVGAILASIAAGASVACTPGFDAHRFFGWLQALAPTWYTAVPTIHQAVAERARHGGDRADARPLRFARSSSAALPPRVFEALEAALGAPVVESYGMTEAAHQMTSNPLPPGERKPASVGVASGPEVAVLDERGRLLPAGAVGEVAIRGRNVFGGYESNPEANRDAFTAGGWFRTGDEGVLDDDGYLFLRGRLKEIINRGGEKISPREIDDVLLDHAAVAEALTFARPHATLGEDVAAAVVLRHGGVAGERDLQKHVASRLAEFKVPRTVVFVEELPRGPTGKLQRTGLADRLGLGLRRPDPGAVPAHDEPGTATERLIAESFARALELAGVGLDDDFFALGGDSLRAEVLFADLAARGLVRQTMLTSTLLWAPTSRRLAAVVEQKDWRPPGTLVPLRTDGTKEPLFLVHPHSGDAVSFGALSARLDLDRPCYALEARLGEEPARMPTVEGLAAVYLEEIRAFQPQGPYYVLGWCMGGGIALELARRLRAEGQEVAVLALVNPIGEPKSSARYYAERTYVAARRGTLGVLATRFVRNTVRSRRGGTATLGARTAFLMAMTAASRGYVAEPYDGAIDLVRTDGYYSAERFWIAVARGGLTSHRARGTLAAAMRPPGVDALASELRGILTR